MDFNYVPVTGKVSHETFGCEPDYFQKHIKGKPLLIIYSSANNYIRVQDQNQEEWGLFPGCYTVITGLGSPETQQKTEAGQEKLPQEKTG